MEETARISFEKGETERFRVKVDFVWLVGPVGTGMKGASTLPFSDAAVLRRPTFGTRTGRMWFGTEVLTDL